MRAAFFDIDGTIYREGLITELFKKLITHELTDAKNWYDDVKPAFMKWDTRRGEYDDYLEKMVAVYVNSIKGINKVYIDFIAQKVIEQKGDRVYTFTRDRIKSHQKNGDMVIAISGSPAALVSKMAKKYNFDDYRATQYCIDENNCFTGETIPMWDSVSKRKAVLEIAKHEHLNLDDCYAYGDTIGDFDMLKLVGHPYAINPTATLLKTILADKEVAQKTTVIVERKDMIYHIPIEQLFTAKALPEIE